jgi:hypothetical protein
MSLSISLDPEKPRVSEVLRLLTLLARRGAWCVMTGDAHARDAAVYVAQRGCMRPAGTVPAEALHAALRSGWVIPEAGMSRWRLSDSGRLHLKRSLAGATEMPRPRASQKERRAVPRTGEISEPGVNPCESPLAWLHRRKDKDGNPYISKVEFEAGERLRADFWFAQMTPRVTANWSPVASRARGWNGSAEACADLADNVIAAQERVRRALAAVGPELAGVLIDICCHLKGLEQIERSAGWPQRSGKIVLHFALMSLARHYGMNGASTPDTAAGPVRVRHWGAADYRPMIDGASEEEE